MSAGPFVNPETSALPPPEESRREGSQRPSNWTSGSIGWGLMGLFVIYPLSIMPAYVTMLMLMRRGIDLYAPYRIFYWPIIWLLDNVALLRRLNDLIEPVLRGLVK